MMNSISIEHDFILKPANTRLVLPTSTRDLNCIVEQTTDVKELKLSYGRLASKRLNSPDSRRSIFGSGLNNIEIADQRRLLHLTSQQLCASENCSQRVVK